MPRSRQARMTRRAISPRLATRILWNISDCRLQIADCHSRLPVNLQSEICNLKSLSACGIDPEQHLPVLDRLLVLDQDLGDDPGALGLDLVIELHRLDQADDRLRGDAAALADV